VQLFESGSKLTEAQALVKIPRFGKNNIVPVYAGVSEGVLARGFGHYDHTASPGQIGNYAIAGHRITHGQPLRDMPELRPGDKVIVITHQARYIYRLDTNPNDLTVPSSAIWVITKDPTNPTKGGVEPPRRFHRLITLTTCSELFHTNNRSIVFGHLVKVIHKPTPEAQPLK
jgi:sortase A